MRQDLCGSAVVATFGNLGKSKRMNRIATTLLACLIFMMASTSMFAQAGKSAEGTKSATASEMPPALKNMEGKPGFDQEHAKWVATQNATPAQEAAQVQKDVQALQNANWKTPTDAPAPRTSSEGTPYHNYKGISDPEKAKAAWERDQKNN
jgi:dihydroorotase-like cyclic amidohydrolase